MSAHAARIREIIREINREQSRLLDEMRSVRDELAARETKYQRDIARLEEEKLDEAARMILDPNHDPRSPYGPPVFDLSIAWAKQRLGERSGS